MSWLEASANRLRQTYIQGFLDISGGGIKLYNDVSINFYNVGSNIPKFSIKSDSMRISDSFGTYYDLSTSQLLYLNGITQNLNTQLSDLVNRTKHITSGTADIDTMFKFDNSNNRVVTYSNIVPNVAYANDLGSPALPFGSLYVKQGTIHFVDENTNRLAASISYDPTAGSLDISANGTKAPINNTRIVNGVYETPLITYDGKVGIGVSTPSHSLDVSGSVNITGNSYITGNVNINNGDVVMDGNLIIGKTLYEGGIPLVNKYLSSTSPIINGIATLYSAIVNNNLTVVGDSSLNGRLYVGGDASFNANLLVSGNLITNTPTTSDNSTLVATTAFVKNQSYAPLSNATFSGTTTMVTGNVQQRFQVAGDVSLNSKLAVFSTATFSNRVYIANDAFMNSRLIVLGDSSLNGNVSINGTLTGVTPSSLDNSTKMATTAYVQNQEYAKLSGAYFTGDVSINNRFIVSGDVSFNNRLFLNGDANLNGNVTTITQSTSDSSTKLATTAFVKNQGYATLLSPTFTGTANMESLNISQRLIVSADARHIGNLDVNGNLTAITQFNSDNSTKVATTQFVKNQEYATLASPTFTGTATIPTVSVTKSILVSGDISLNGKLFVSNDASLNGNLTVNGILKGTTPDTTDSSTKLATTAYVQNQAYAKLSGATFTGDISLNKRIFVGEDVSFNSNLAVIGNTNLLGNTYAQTPSTGDNSSLVATTAYVQSQAYSKIDSPEFTGIPTAPTAQYGTNSTQIATTEFVVTQLFSFINSNEDVYNSLQQLSTALSATDASFATTLATSLGMKADKDSPVFTGSAVIPYLNVLNGLISYGDASFNGKLFVNGDTSMNGNVSVVTQSVNDNSSKVASTAFVQNQGYAKLAGATFTGSLNTSNNLSVGGNAILNNMVTIIKDLSLNGNLTVDGKTTFSDIITLLKSIIINGDLSLNGNLSVNGNSTVITQGTTDNSTKIATTAYVQNQGYAKLAGANFTGDVSLNSSLTVVGDVSLNKRLFIASDVSLNSNLFVNGITTINDKTIMMGDASLNSNLMVQQQIYENGVSLINKYATLESPTFTGTVNGISKSMVGLSNVDNTADIYKPISTATQVALGLKSNIASPTFTGIATIPIVNVTDKLMVSNDVSFNGKMFVANDVSLNGNVSINGTLLAPTPLTSDNSIKVATTEFVKNQNYISKNGGNFSGAVTFDDNLTVLGDLSLNGKLFTNGDVSFNSNVFISGRTLLNADASLNGNLSLANNLSMNGNLSIKGDISLNGVMTTPTPSTSDNSTKVATTAFVKNQGYALLAGANFIGDVSMNGNMLVQKDTTLNQRLFLTGDASINSNISVGGNITTNANLLVSGKTVLNSDVSLNSRLYIANDVSMNGKLFVIGDASMNGNMNIGGILTTKTQDTSDSSNKVATTAFVKNQGYATLASPSFTGTATATTFTVTQNLISNSDAYMQSNLNVAVDATIGGNLSVAGSITAVTPLSSDNSTLVATTEYVKSQPFAPLASPTFTGTLVASVIDISNNLVVLGDISLNGNMNVDGTITTKTPSTNDNSTKIATTAFVKNQPFAPLASPTFTGTLVASTIDISNNLIVLGDASMNSNLYIGKSIYENGVELINKYARLASPSFTGIVSGITKSMVDLSNVDNTSDINKPISTAQQTALNLKANIASPTFSGLLQASYIDISNNLTIHGDASMNGNVNIDGSLTAKTPASDDSSIKVATTAYVQNQGYAKLSGAYFTGDLSNNGNLITNGNLTVYGNTILSGITTSVTQISSDNSTRVATTEFVQNIGFAKLNSPAFTGIPTAPTLDTTAPTTTQIATTKYVENKISDFFNTASASTLSAITQLSQALSNTDASFTTAIATQLAVKANIESPTFTGVATIPTANITENIQIGGDISLNGNLTTGGLVYENGTALVNKYATLNSPAFTGTVTGITKSMVGLSNLDNTADIYKPVSTAQQTALNLKANIASPSFTGLTRIVSGDISSNLYVGGDVSMNGNLIVSNTVYENGLPLANTYATLASPTFTGIVSGITKSMVDLSNVDNTSDINKPVSTAQQTALNLKANIASPSFTGTTSIAQNLIVGGDASINGIITTTTPASSDNSNKVATTAYVKNQNANFAVLSGANFTGDISLNTRLFVGSDASLNGKVYVGKDLQVIGNITGNYPSNSIPLSAVIGGLGSSVDLSTNQTISGVKTFMNDVSLNSRLFIGGNLTIAGNNIVSNLYQTASDPSVNTISNLLKLTNNANGTYINEFEISKSNGFTITYNTTNGTPVISNNGGIGWNTMTTTGTNTIYNAMVCISPDGRIILKQEYNSSTNTPYLYISTNWGTSYTSISLAQSIIYNNAYYGYNTYNNQSYAFSHDGSVLYFIARDSNNTFSLWKNTDSSFNSFTKQGSSWSYTLSNCPRAIATSGNGQYVLAITGVIPTNGMYLYQSSNYGVTFTKTANSLNTTWNSIAVSYSGKYQTAIDNNKIYQSSDFGITWAIVSSTPTAKWNFISMSNNGKNRVACIDTSYQYLSLDYGSNWSVIPNSFGNWKKAVMVDTSDNNIAIFSHDGVNIYKNYYYCIDTLQKTTINSDLTITTPYHYLNNIGKMVNPIKTNYFINDSGVKIGISNDGKYIVLPVANKQSLLSQDYGYTWNYLNGLSAQTDYKYAVVSGNGQYMFIRKGSTTYWSINYGLTWSLFTGVANTTDNLGGIALSSTGQYMVFAGLDSTNNSNVYVSSNYGSTWTLSTAFPTSNNNFSAAISESGQYMSVLSTNSYLFVSSDFGSTWTSKYANSSINFTQISMSSNGQYQTLINATNLFVSSNYGANFNCTYSSSTTPNFTSITMIGTGEYQYAVNSNDNKLYISNDYGNSWNQIYTNSVQPSKTTISRDGTTMVYSASGDIYMSRVADNTGSISSTAISISRKGIVSALDLSVNGTISTNSMIVNQIYENGNLLASKYATINSPAFTGTVTGITKAMIDLSNVDNTSDMNKPISTATQNALNLKSNIASPSFTGVTNMQYASIANSLFITNDMSMNGNLLIMGDMSLNGNLYANYAPNTIPIDAIKGGIPSATGVFSYDISANLRLYVNGDVSMNSKLTVKNDGYFQNRLFVTSDVSFNKNIYVFGNSILNKDVYINGNAYLSKDISVTGDASMAGRLFVVGNMYENNVALSDKYASIDTPSFQGTATFEKVAINQLFTVVGDSSIDGNLTTTKDITTIGNLTAVHIYEGTTLLSNKYAPIESPTFTGTVNGITKTMIGLGNVNNTSDADKPVSTAQQTALDLKANLVSPTFTGVPLAPTANVGTNTSQIATTAYVRGEIYNLIGTAPSTLDTLQELANAINSDASFATTIANEIGLKAPIANPIFTGVLTTPNLSINDSLIAGGDVSMNSHLSVALDSSFNGNLYVGGKLEINSSFAVNERLFVGGDLSVNGNITGHYKDYSIPSTAIQNIRNQYGEFQIQTQRADIVEFDDEGFELSRSSGHSGYVETLYAYESDLSLNGNLYINGTGTSVFVNDVAVDSRLIVNNDTTLEGNLYVAQNAILTHDVSMNSNLDLSGALIAHNNLNVYGIINQYTLSLEDGYKVNYENDHVTIASLQSQVATLQNQITSILQILSNNNLQ